MDSSAAETKGKEKKMAADEETEMADWLEAKGRVRHLIDSCNFRYSLFGNALNGIRPVEVYNPLTKQLLKLRVSQCILGLPKRNEQTMAPLRPFDCTQEGLSYTGTLSAHLSWSCDDVYAAVTLNLGQIPIMLMSKYCNIKNYDPDLLEVYKEDPLEVGGCFILDGVKTVVPPVILPKRNYPMAIWHSIHGNYEGHKAIAIRCVRELDGCFVTVKLYYMKTQTAKLGVRTQGEEVLLPVGVILKALVDVPDDEILKNLAFGKLENGKLSVGNQHVLERAKNILQQVKNLGLSTQCQCMEYIGRRVKHLMWGLEKENYQVGRAFIDDYILVHLSPAIDKFNLLMFMLRKLYSLVDYNCVVDDPDSLQNQEVLLPGDLVSIYLKEKVVDWLQRTKTYLQNRAQMGENKNLFRDVQSLNNFLVENPSNEIGVQIQEMLKTGELFTQTGLGLHQGESFSSLLLPKRVSFVTTSLPESASFAGLHTTSVWELYNEPQGFLRTVIRDDGERCLHLTSTCRITSCYDAHGQLKKYHYNTVKPDLVKIGMSLEDAAPPAVPVISVLFDGAVIGWITLDEVEEFVAGLRHLKVTPDNDSLPNHLEVGYVPSSNGLQYPGVYIFSTPSRFVRTVYNTSLGQDELIGPFEQGFMKIRSSAGRDGGGEEAATREEIHGYIYPSQESDSMKEENSKEEENKTMGKKVTEHGTSSDPSQSTFLIPNEDHTLANAVRFILNQDPRTSICGYSIPHPLENQVNFRIQTTGDPARDVLVDACRNLREVCQHVSRTFGKAINVHKMRNQLDDMDINAATEL